MKNLVVLIFRLTFSSNNFINSKILDFAIIPDENFYHENFHVQIDGGGSSFVRGLYNGNKSPEEKFKVLEVKIMTVKDLIENYVDFEIDFLLTDCEGYDFDINKKIIEINKPKIIHMEAWDTKDLHLSQKITTRDEMCEFLENNGYEIYFNKIGEHSYPNLIIDPILILNGVKSISSHKFHSK